jgi:general secretion pathway protein E
VRYRIDGVLHEVESPPRLSAAVISRVKIMANLDIAERRLPQDGRIKLRIQGKELDLRVSTVPTVHGESVVMRDARPAGVRSTWLKLGFEPDTLRASSPCWRAARHPAGHRPHRLGQDHHALHGARKLNTPDVKIITVEDPVEYQIEGINQIQAKPQINLTSPTRCVRSCARTRTSS